MSQFFHVFFDESDELLAEMERLLLNVDTGAADVEELNAIFRAAHSIKGGAATFGLGDIAEVTHVLETLLDKLRKGEMQLASKHVDAFLAAKDVLQSQVDGHRKNAPADQTAIAAVMTNLHSLANAPVPTQAPFAVQQPAEANQAAPDRSAQERQFRIELPDLSARDLTAIENELALLGEVTKQALDKQRYVMTLVGEATAEDIVAICSFILDPADLKICEEALPESGGAALPEKHGESDPGFGFFVPLADIRADAQKAAASAAPPRAALQETKHAAGRESGKATQPESTSIRVGIEKVDQLINLVGELVITRAMIEQLAGALDPMTHERLLNGVNQLSRNTRDLQEAVMGIRMLPMDYVFSRFPRMVRDLAAKLGKKVEFITQGAATELDKGLIERIVDPLTHLVRNSVDHGIELPVARKAAGKSEAGRLTLSAAHQGGNIVIEVADDGGGLDRHKILAKARQQGLPVSDAMSDDEVWQLIFAPGFSTAEQVTDVSGRGVGLDVVKRNITALAGHTEIRSARGYGTSMRISLPLTLAILDGMSIKVGNEIYILPLGYVVESLQPKPSDINFISGKGTVLKVREEYLPLVRLFEMFGIEPRITDPSLGIVVILEANSRKIGLLVDDLVGQQQVVVKNLESNYRKVAGISGATILGDGSVALILDVAQLIRSSRQLQPHPVLSQ